METVEFDHDGVLTETPDAKLFDTGDGSGVWIPKSEILEETEDTCIIPEWLAVERGLA